MVRRFRRGGFPVNTYPRRGRGGLRFISPDNMEDVRDVESLNAYREWVTEKRSLPTGR
jgi:hypothetical protein